MKNVWIVIPARKGSKGFPHKNRYLFDYTAAQIPDFLRHRTIVTTDDEQLLTRAKNYEFNVLHREKELSADDTSMRLVISDAREKFNISPKDDIITLYLTYPQRTMLQIQKVYDFYLDCGASSLLCKKHVDIHPYMCYYTLKHFRGSKIVDHNLYRRQEYPECFEASHYVVITKSDVLDELDNNLYHKNTIFYSLGGEIFDVDYSSDFENFKRINKNG
jgi:CMP-N-acetylneuraminic acid synthetase